MKSGTKILQIDFRHFQVVLMKKDRHKHTKNGINTTAVIGSVTEIGGGLPWNSIYTMDSQPDG